LALSRTDIARCLSQKIIDHALETGADAIVTACPLCQSNLDSRQEEMSRETGKRYELPILYFSELIGVALGYEETGKWFRKHFVNPAKILAAKGLI